MIYVDEDTSDKNDRGFDAGVTPPRYTRDRGPDDGYYGVEGNHPVREGEGVMLCQRALLERMSSAGNEPNRANFGTRRRLQRARYVIAGLVGAFRQNDD